MVDGRPAAQIGPALTGDFLSVAALDRIAWPTEPATFIPDGEHIWRVWSEHGTLLVARVSDEDVLPHSGSIAGALVMFPTHGSELFLHKIMVHPACRGYGLGTALMQHALDLVDRPVLLTVDPENSAAVQLYRGFGFEIREQVAGYYRPHEDRYIMEYVPR